MHYDRKSQGLGPAVYLWWRLKCWKVVSADTAMTWPAVFLCFRRVGGRAVCGDGMDCLSCLVRVAGDQNGATAFWQQRRSAVASDLDGESAAIGSGIWKVV